MRNLRRVTRLACAAYLSVSGWNTWSLIARRPAAASCLYLRLTPVRSCTPWIRPTCSPTKCLPCKKCLLRSEQCCCAARQPPRSNLDLSRISVMPATLQTTAQCPNSPPGHLLRGMARSHSKRDFESATARLLTQGGDTRIELNAAGIKSYGCGPRPDAPVLSFGSS